ESVRQALGYGQIQLYGYSYGTQVVANYALEFPANVELAAIDGVQYPTARDPFLRPAAQNATRVLDSVYGD
ncbi:alpha/beta fold hydrolase, partial [Escherichia coli]|uniref:alpha/beta fold hydrolase n=1 Tax=Escherichia coli TaxID=562 RepID=UPI003CE59DAD